MEEKIFRCPLCKAKFSIDTNDEVVVCPSCKKQVLISDDEIFTIGAMIDDFQIIAKLGKLPIGTAYLAYHSSMEQNIIMNILSEEATRDNEKVTAFNDSITPLSEFIHPNIIDFFENREDDGIYYSISSYLKGQDIKTILGSHGRFSPAEALHLALKIVDILEEASNKGFVYGGLNVGNVIYDITEDEVYLLNVDISLFYDTQYRQISHYYMSPEQTRDEPLSWNSDIYSLGILLFQITTGVLPFDSEDIGTVYAMHTATPLPDPNKVNPRVFLPLEFVNLLKKMLGKLPRDRFESWKELISEIKRIMPGIMENKEIAESKSNFTMPLNPSKSQKVKKVKKTKIAAPKKRAKNTLGAKTASVSNSKKTTGGKASVAKKKPDNQERTRVMRKSKSKKKSTSPGMIIGIGVGIILFLTFTVVLITNSQKQNAAKAAYDKAFFAYSKRTKQEPYNFTRAKSLLKNAIPKVQGTKYEKAIDKYYKEVSKELKLQIEAFDLFDKSYMAAGKKEDEAKELKKNAKEEDYKEVLGKFNEAKTDFDNIKPVKDPERMERLKGSKLYLSKYISNLSDKIIKRDKKIEKARIAEEARVKAEEMRIAKIKRDKELAEKREKDAREKGLKLNLKRIANAKKLLYDKPFKLAAELNFKEALKSEILAVKVLIGEAGEAQMQFNDFEEQKKNVNKILYDALTVWNEIANSKELFNKIYLSFDEGKYAIKTINNGEITLRKTKTFPEKIKKVKIEDLTEEQFLNFIQSADKISVSPETIINFCIAIGKFDNAKSLISNNEDWGEFENKVEEFIVNSLISKVEYIYLLLSSIESLSEGKEKLNEFKAKYGNSPEVKKVQEYFNEKYPDNNMDLSN